MKSVCRRIENEAKDTFRKRLECVLATFYFYFIFFIFSYLMFGWKHNEDSSLMKCVHVAFTVVSNERAKCGRKKKSAKGKQRNGDFYLLHINKHCMSSSMYECLSAIRLLCTFFHVGRRQVRWHRRARSHRKRQQQVIRRKEQTEFVSIFNRVSFASTTKYLHTHSQVTLARHENAEFSSIHNAQNATHTRVYINILFQKLLFYAHENVEEISFRIQ